MRRIVLYVLFGFFLSVFSVAVGNAQELYGNITGVIADPTGARVQEAQVTATNQLTGIVKSTSSDKLGTFELLQLPVGAYDVEIEKSGFKTYSVSAITLVLDQVYNLPVTLQLGGTTETITVQADNAQVEESTTQLDTLIGSQTIVDLPLDGRNWTQLQQLVPGVMGASDRFNLYSTNGAQTQQNSYLIDGANSMVLLTNTPGIIPSPDAIQEFNLISSTMDAEYSRNGGAILNAVFKSGTNRFHGSAFEFYRDTFLNARNFFQLTAPVFHQNQFGGTIGGPIWKDHTFFFFSYQGTRARQPQSGGGGLVPVFTPAQRTGNFSNGSGTCPFGSSVSPIPLTDSNGNPQPAGTPYCTLFPEGVIPSADINSISSKLLPYVPGIDSANNEFSFNPLTTATQDQEILRLDHTFSRSDMIWGSIFIESYPTSDTLPSYPYGASVPGFGDVSLDHSKNFSVDWMHTFGGTSVNEFRVSYQRVNQTYGSPQQTISPSSLGFTISPQDPSAEAIPYISVFGLFNLGFSQYGPQTIVDQNLQLSDNFSKIVGKHTLKIGFSGTRYNLNYEYDEFNSGAYYFDGEGTFSTGVPGADFLLGIPDTYYQDTAGELASRSYEYYAYVQDSWRATQNLTLNYGLGYQIDTPLNNFDFGGLASNCFNLKQQSTTFPTAPVGLLFPGDAGCSQSGYHTQYGHVAPRFGFAYNPQADRKLVIRGGFGIYYNRNIGELQNPFLSVSPFNLFQEGVGQIGGSPSLANPWSGWELSSTGVAPVTYANPYPYIAPAKGTSVNFSNYEPMAPYVTDPNLTSASAMNFNLNVQQELPGRMILQVGYVGSLGRHLNLVTNLNPISLAGAAECVADPICSAYYHFYQDYYYPGHFQTYPGNILSSLYEEFSGGNSSYNSLQVSLSKHLSHGLYFLASYTWSHSIDNGSGYEDSIGEYGAGLSTNPYNPAVDRADSAFDARQRFVTHYEYTIPGIGRFTQNTAANAILNGWRLSGITTLQTGFPFSITDSSDPSFTVCGCDTANLVGKFTVLNPRNNPTHSYFNTSAFQEAPAGGFGNLGRNPFHGPGINNTDLALAKTIPAGESRSFELRFEAFNAFNHTQFLAPVGDIHNPQFGQIMSAAGGRVIQLGAKFYF